MKLMSPTKYSCDDLTSPEKFTCWDFHSAQNERAAYSRHHTSPVRQTLGFTLIELLVVIVIISIVATFAVLSISVNQNKRLEALTNQLVNSFTLAEQEALLRPATIGFELTENNYQFVEYHETTSDGEKKHSWQPLTAPLNSQTIPSDIQLIIKINDKIITKRPQLVISPSGEITPFNLYISKKGSSPRYKIIGEGSGNIKSEPIYEEQ